VTDSESPLVELRKVSRTFHEAGRSHVVLREASVEIRRGAFIVLLGRSGSGKTTLLHLIGGIERPDGGVVRVAGRELSSAPERERTLFRRAHVGIIFQSLNLIPTLTVRENVELRLELNGRLDAIGRARAEELLAQVGLADRQESAPDVLSGGEQQRVAIAAALVHDPDLILADEPTGNLDAARGAEIVELLDTLVRRRGKTLVMATHSPEMVGVADHILRIEAGRIVETRPGSSPPSPSVSGANPG
jgi:putative ABC transport system ATP-binding protein